LLRRLLTSRFGAACVLASCTLGLLRCASGAADEAIGVSRQAIVGGNAVADAPSSPVLYLSGPGGTCSSVLVAPTLALTALHCVSYLSETGSFDCTASGTLTDGSTSGLLGDPYAAGLITFYSAESVASGRAIGETSPDAVGAQIFSTQAPSVCSDDLALVVLNKPIPGLIPAPVRLSLTETEVDEPVNVWGYGLTQTPGAPTALRVSQGAEIVGIGPSESTTLTEPAPLRAVRIGPGTTTCNGDSGGPIMSKDGEVIALVSLGLQSTNGLDCPSGNNPDTTGPLLANYKDLYEEALAAANTSLPKDASSDARSDSGHGLVHDTGTTHPSDGSDSPEPSELTAQGGSCAVGPGAAGSSPGLDGVALAFAVTAGAIGRRRG
jgi:hypothetical protein